MAPSVERTRKEFRELGFLHPHSCHELPPRILITLFLRSVSSTTLKDVHLACVLASK